MKSSDEMRQFLENLMTWGLDRPWMYGGSPYTTNSVFWQWCMIWAELMERSHKFEEITGDEESDVSKPEFSERSHQASTNPVEYKAVVDYWRAVDQRLGVVRPTGG